MHGTSANVTLVQAFPRRGACGGSVFSGTTHFSRLGFQLALARVAAAAERKTGVLSPWPLLAGAVCAEDVSSFGDEAFAGQVEGASFTVEAVFVPGASLVVHHVHAFTETWNQNQKQRKGVFSFLCCLSLA